MEVKDGKKGEGNRIAIARRYMNDILVAILFIERGTS